jgi:tetratricopeptide (TPR) repeat protein
METSEIESILLRNTAELSDLRRQINDILSKEKRVAMALASLNRRSTACLTAFHRDQYKSTDNRLQIRALADEILIFDRLGYEVGVTGARFLVGVGQLLEGRNQSALDHFDRFINEADPDDPHLGDAHYLCGMICYNRRDFSRAIDHFDTTFNHSTRNNPDWQSKIYVGEILFFLRRTQDEIERTFHDVEDVLHHSDDTSDYLRFLRATLYLKWGNCYVGTLDLEPTQSNALVNNQLAVRRYKEAQKALPRYVPNDSLLPVVIDYSLAQALLSSGSIDMDLAMTPSELLADVFSRLRRIVLTKREEIILAQSYFMLGTCASYSRHVSNELGEIYLEYARAQTLTVPSDVCFYSCITKDLVTRDAFVQQIDYYTSRLQQDTR